LRAALRRQPAHIAKIAAAFTEIAAVEPAVSELLSPQSELETEGYGQLFFTASALKPLNDIPRLLSAWTFMKLWLTPLAAVSLPVLTVIGPYILVRYVFGQKMTFGEYLRVAKRMYFGGSGADAEGAGQQLKGLVQMGLSAATMAQSVYQPIQSAVHLRHIDATVRATGENIARLVAASNRLRDLFLEIGVKLPAVPFPAAATAMGLLADKRRLVAYCIEHPFSLQLLLEWIGAWEVAVAMATHPQIIPIVWRSSAEGEPVYIHLRDTCDIMGTGTAIVAAAKQKPFSVSLGGGKASPHALLTGPNRGGKSTVLRALLRSVVLAHTYGVAIGSYCEMTPIDWIQSSLRMEDLPGTASLFEREVAFAKESLRRPAHTRGLICIDELFHSTNPPDAAAASRGYLRALWARTGTASIISTHIFPLVEEAPPTVQRLCCPADEDAAGTVIYRYGLECGICKVSSVRDIIGSAFSAS
jgi:hypothetical protein